MTAAGESSHRQILTSSALVGGASVINVCLGLIRMKAAAILLGPAGVGLIGLLQNLLAAGSAAAGMGIGGAATRQLAAQRASRGDEGEAEVRRAMLWGTGLLALTAAAVIWALQLPIATHLLADATLAPTVGWLGVGTAMAVVAATQVALLTGLRKIGRVARLNIWAGLLSTGAGLAALLLWREEGVLAFVLATPAAALVAGWWYTRRLSNPGGDPSDLRATGRQLRLLLALGAAIMIGGLIAGGGQLAVRAMISEQLGLAALGLFQAAWAISMTYLGLVLHAMGADYYPRLSEAIGNPPEARRLVSEQTEVALMLGAPVLLAMMGAAPLALDLLFSAEFREAADILRWQIAGDLLKIAAWPLGFVLLAAGRGKAYILLEALTMTVFIAVTAALLPRIGLEASGFAFLAMYVFYLPAVAWTARTSIGSCWTRKIVALMVFHGAGLALISTVSLVSEIAALMTGAILASASLYHAIRQIEHALPGPIAAAVRKLTGPRRTEARAR